MNASSLIQKVWNLCHTLRDDGVSYGDYLEQLTYLLFLKFAEESESNIERRINLPSSCRWVNLTKKSGMELEGIYEAILKELSLQKGELGAIFDKAENKISDPAKLSNIIKMIDEENWSNLTTDTKGDIYEGLLQKNAEDTKSGAGQYFTPRPIIQAIVECIRPKSLKTISDPACGTGGFFLGSLEWLLKQNLNEIELQFLQNSTFSGNEIVSNTRRLCLMNLYLHGIGDFKGIPAIKLEDALIHKPKEKVDYVLANPPFGKSSSTTITIKSTESQENDELTHERSDFWASTSNKQLNFLQHIVSMLKIDGEAAVVLPDNVLFESGAGEKIRRQLLMICNVHTILRLPTGIFYANGVKANVVFFKLKKSSSQPNTKGIWFYDLRTNKKFTLKTKPLTTSDLQEFISCYNPDNIKIRHEVERFKYYSYDQIIKRDKANLDIFWLKDDSLNNLADLPSPNVLQEEIVEHLEKALSLFKSVSKDLNIT